MDLYRSLLFVPAHKADWARKAQRYEPDAVILDLEDGVPFSKKPLARQSPRELVGDGAVSFDGMMLDNVQVTNARDALSRAAALGL